MIFDKLARAVERGIPKLVQILNSTRLFVFPGRAHEILHEDDEIDIDFVRENFFLPFQHIAVEDTASCILLWDDSKGQRGLSHVRHFIECMSFATPSSEFNTRRNTDGSPGLTDEQLSVVERAAKVMPNDALAVSTGTFKAIYLERQDGKCKFIYDAEVSGVMVARTDGTVIPPQLLFPTESDARLVANGTIRNAGAAIQEVNYLNSPDRFILEEMPEDYEKRRVRAQKLGRVMRRHERPTHTPLYPREIRRRLHLPPVNAGGPKQPHERRAHTRTYPDDPVQWPHAHGKTIVIPSSWIGPSSATIGNKRYRVLLG